MDLQTIYGKGPHRLLLAGSRTTRGETTVSGTSNRLSYCVIFVAHAQFTHVSAGRIIQACGPRVGSHVYYRAMYVLTTSSHTNSVAIKPRACYTSVFAITE